MKIVSHKLTWALLLVTIFLLTVDAVWAQIAPVPSINLSSTITSTNTFQSIQAQTNNRRGCTVQNNGTHTMYVFFGPIANATTATSVALSPSQPVRCEVNSDNVLIDQVSITGTSGDAFFANFQ